jgi:hypothetical protein
VPPSLRGGARRHATVNRAQRAAFAQKPDVGPPRKTARQQREEVAAKKAGMVDRRVEIGRELAEIRDVTPNNVRFGSFAGASG